jgi:hypothetical protein
MGESMVKYTKKLIISKVIKKWSIFWHKQNEIEWKHDNPKHNKSMMIFFKFIVRWLQNLNNFGIIKVDNKYVWKWLIKLVKPTFPLKVWCIILYYLNIENLQIYFKTTLGWKWIIFNNSSIFTYLYKFE